ncbi:unannotated protein [freshwater metagenome]|uniref:Unannotated protein n=1 Tax=freshwater metagenome TaxID=449393 RepID=A0A6J7HHM6_9ZZZZ|nr:hypothetical protein [Actinomycetota bacterium]
MPRSAVALIAALLVLLAVAPMAAADGVFTASNVTTPATGSAFVRTERAGRPLGSLTVAGTISNTVDSGVDVDLWCFKGGTGVSLGRIYASGGTFSATVAVPADIPGWCCLRALPTTASAPAAGCTGPDVFLGGDQEYADAGGVYDFQVLIPGNRQMTFRLSSIGGGGVLRSVGTDAFGSDGSETFAGSAALYPNGYDAAGILIDGHSAVTMMYPPPTALLWGSSLGYAFFTRDAFTIPAGGSAVRRRVVSAVGSLAAAGQLRVLAEDRAVVPVVLARGTASRATAGKVAVTLRLTAAGRRLVRRAGVKAAVTANGTFKAQGTAKTALTLRLRG